MRRVKSFRDFEVLNMSFKKTPLVIQDDYVESKTRMNGLKQGHFKEMHIEPSYSEQTHVDQDHTKDHDFALIDIERSFDTHYSARLNTMNYTKIFLCPSKSYLCFALPECLLCAASDFISISPADYQWLKMLLTIFSSNLYDCRKCGVVFCESPIEKIINREGDFKKMLEGLESHIRACDLIDEYKIIQNDTYTLIRITSKPDIFTLIGDRETYYTLFEMLQSIYTTYYNAYNENGIFGKGRTLYRVAEKIIYEIAEPLGFRFIRHDESCYELLV